MQKMHLEPFGEGPQRVRRLIAVIDDSPTIRKVVETCLRREGFAVQSFPDGIEAIRSFAQPDVRLPDLLLLDLCLPTLDGYGVLQHLKSNARLCAVPVVLLSRRNGLLDKVRGRLLGANTHLEKPVTTEQLKAVVALYLGTSENQPR